MATKSMFALSDDELDEEDEKVSEDLVVNDKDSDAINAKTAEDDQFSDDEDFCAALETSVNDDQVSDEVKAEMTKAEKERAEKNRLKALTLKKTRVLAHPSAQQGDKSLRPPPHKSAKLVDSGGGFFIDEQEQENDKRDNIKFVEGPAPFLKHDRPDCLECEKKFDDSYLLRSFDHAVCDNCREMGKDGEHELITKTEAKATFLLKDFDLEKTEQSEALMFIVKKNPHNPRGGEMKLYLRLQVEKRAVEVWGTQEALEEEIESREEKKVELKSRKYNRQLKALRMAARSSLYKKDISTHVHQYEDEVYHEDKDEYSQTCATCGHINTYEKM